MRSSPSLRKACRLTAACAGLLLSTAASSAQSLELRHPYVPDANPPTASVLGVPCTADFSAPTAAANLLGFWDSTIHSPYGHWNAAGATAGLSGPELSEHLSWFMATNSRRDSTCASAGVDEWGRANARTGATEGTRIGDLVPGLVEYLRWDGLHPFPGPSPRPSLPPGKRAYDWRMQTFLNPDESPEDLGFVYDYTGFVYFQPLLVTFRHWHLTFLCADGGIEYYDWLPSVSGTDDPAFAPNYSGGGTPPTEHWNGDNLGHAVVGIGFHSSYQPSCTSAPRDWFIVRDGIPNTGATVAVPFFYDEFGLLTWMTSFMILRDAAVEPDLVIDAAGNRHVVWAGGPPLTPVPQIYYAGNATSGVPLTGTQIEWGTDPSIAIDPNSGHLAIAFSSAWEIDVTTNALGSWNGEEVSGTPLHPAKPSIAIDSASHTHVIWQEGCPDYDPCPWGVDVRLGWNDKLAGGSWGTAQPLFDPDNFDVSPDQVSPNFDPDLAVHGTQVHLVYDHGHGEIKYLAGTIAGGVIAWDFDSLRTVNTATGHPVRAPKIAVDGAGDVYVVWSDQRSGVWQTYHQARRAGSWLPADLALSAASTSASGPDLSLRNAPNGTYVDVVWEEELPAGNYEIMSASLFAGAGGDVTYPGAIGNRSATASPSQSPAVAYNAALGTIDVAFADDSVVLLPEVGLAGLLAGIAAIAALRRS